MKIAVISAKAEMTAILMLKTFFRKLKKLGISKMNKALAQ